jgi:ABC-type molybdate transport system substrate-binding protein
MRNIMRFAGMAVIVAAMFFVTPAKAAAQNEIASITVLADSRLAVAFSEIASRFAHESMISVSGTFGAGDEQKKKIEDGESADLFITSDMQLIQQLKTKGLVDVYSIGRVASHHDIHYTAAIVASENMTPARNFLAFLKSPEARDIFRKNGMSAP